MREGVGAVRSGARPMRPVTRRHVPPKLRDLAEICLYALANAGCCWLGVVGDVAPRGHLDLFIEQEAKRGVRDLECDLRASDLERGHT